MAASAAVRRKMRGGRCRPGDGADARRAPDGL